MAVTRVEFKVAVADVEIMTESQLLSLRGAIDLALVRCLMDLNTSATLDEVTVENISGAMIYDSED